MKYRRIVLNEPHASVEGLYDDRLSGWDIDNRFINEVVNHLTDWHTDYLFHGFRHEDIKAVRFPYSRFIVDAERLWDDPLEAEGQGIIYRHFDCYMRNLPKQHEARLLKLWKGHQQKLRNNLCQDALLIDCHSFPEDKGDVDICIGYNEDWSKQPVQQLGGPGMPVRLPVYDAGGEQESLFGETVAVLEDPLQ